MAAHDQQNNELTVIGRGTTIRGEVDFDQGARILGVFEGKIRSQGEVQIGETAECRAEVNASKVRIEGRLEGNVTARDRLHLAETAHMTGDICATRLCVDEGATFIGHCRVGEGVTDSAGQTPAATPAARQTAPGSRAAEPKPAATRPSPLTVDVNSVDFKPPWRDAARTVAATAAAGEADDRAENGAA